MCKSHIKWCMVMFDSLFEKKVHGQKHHKDLDKCINSWCNNNNLSSFFIYWIDHCYHTDFKSRYALNHNYDNRDINSFRGTTNNFAHSHGIIVEYSAARHRNFVISKICCLLCIRWHIYTFVWVTINSKFITHFNVYIWKSATEKWRSSEYINFQRGISNLCC